MVGLLFILGFLGFLLVAKLVRERRAGFARFAARQGLRYETSGASLPLAEFSGFSLFHTGWESSVRHLVFGRYGDFHIYMFEFSFTSGPEMNDPETTQTVMAVPLPSVPPFRLRPVSSGFGRTETSSRKEMTLDADEWSPEDRVSTFSDSLIERAGRAPGWHVEGNGNWIVFWQASRLVSPDDAGSFLDDALDLARALRKH